MSPKNGGYTIHEDLETSSIQRCNECCPFDKNSNAICVKVLTIIYLLVVKKWLMMGYTS